METKWIDARFDENEKHLNDLEVRMRIITEILKPEIEEYMNKEKKKVKEVTKDGIRTKERIKEE